MRTALYEGPVKAVEGWRVAKAFFSFYTQRLTTWSRGLLEKLTVSELVRKFPVFYGTWRFITAFTRARHLSLS
jgi:hypothetical protein